MTLMTEQLEVRLHGAASLPTLIYLPGTHGDWTLIAGFRKALGGRVRFAEVTYPRTLTWSLDDCAAAVEAALAEQGITRGWLLGESFGSQVVWAMVARKRVQVEGVILAGGFVRHPARWAAGLGARLVGAVPLSVLRCVLVGYARVNRFRQRHSPEVVSGIQQFIERRTELDRRAAQHRLNLIAQNDPCWIARQVTAPVYALTGLFDPLVPGFCVRHWLRRNCPNLQEYRIIWRADHNVLSTAPQTAAEWVVKWMASSPSCLRRTPRRR